MDKHIAIKDKNIEVWFPYDEQTVARVKTLPDRRYKNLRRGRFWVLPASPYHAQQVLNLFGNDGFSIDPELRKLAASIAKVTEKATAVEAPYLKDLYPFQAAAVQFLKTVGGRAILADEMGLGKTVEALTYARLLGDRVKQTVIVAPASVTYKWKNECERWLGKGWSAEVVEKTKGDMAPARVLIMSYAVATARYLQLVALRPDLLIMDECFVAGTQVETSKGRKNIEDVQVGEYVASFNHSLHVVEYRRVSEVYKRPAPSMLYNIGGNISTGNHPYFTEEEGYVAASKTGGKTVRVLQSYVYDNSQGQGHGSPLFTQLRCLSPKQGIKKETQSLIDQASRLGEVPVVREGNETQTKCGKRSEGLFSKMQRFASLIHPRGEGRVCASDYEYSSMEQGKKRPGIRRAHADTQPNVDARGQREGNEIQRRAYLPSKGRQWSEDQATVETMEATRMGGGIYGVGNPSEYSSGSIPEPAQSLQSGLSLSICEAGNRGGWEDPQATQVEVPRSSEDRDTQLFRVDSIEIYERGSGSRYEEVCPDGNVYNLEVEGNNNYFAGGILVHNCHALKGEKSQRARAFKQYAVGVPFILALSASPFLNRPQELWNILHVLDPLTWNKAWDFYIRYCGYEQTYFGWQATGATNQEELAQRLKTVMVRRLKKDVLEQLPALRRVILPVKIDMKEYKLARKNRPPNALAWLNQLRQIVGKGKAAAAIEWAKDFLESTDEKLVIYAHHHEVVETLEMGLSQYGVTSITGLVTSNKERAARVEAFQTKPRPRVMIISSAGGEGIDLFAASSLLVVEREWGPLPEEQVEGRLHRIGQPSAVVAYYMAAKGTLDTHFAKLVDEKRETFHKIIGGAKIETQIQNEILEVLEKE